MPGAAESIVKVVVSGNERVMMLEVLRVQMNISRASLFPGLDGFAQSLRHEVIRGTSSEEALAFFNSSALGLSRRQTRRDA